MRTQCRLTIELLLVMILAGSVHAGGTDGCLDIYWIDVEGGAASGLCVLPADAASLAFPGRGAPDCSRDGLETSLRVGACLPSSEVRCRGVQSRFDSLTLCA